jgi:hypothetical protein
MLRILGGVCLWAIVTLSVAHAQSTTPVNEVEFDLAPTPAFKTCLGPNPQAHVKVTRGELNDTLDISISGIHPKSAVRFVHCSAEQPGQQRPTGS